VSGHWLVAPAAIGAAVLTMVTVTLRIWAFLTPPRTPERAA
jgi:hypothetical protein